MNRIDQSRSNFHWIDISPTTIGAMWSWHDMPCHLANHWLAKHYHENRFWHLRGSNCGIQMSIWASTSNLTDYTFLLAFLYPFLMSLKSLLIVGQIGSLSGLAEKMLATNVGAYETLVSVAEIKSANTQIREAAITALASLLDGNPDPLDESGFKVISETLSMSNDVEQTSLAKVTLGLTLNCCVRHEQNRQNLVKVFVILQYLSSHLKYAFVSKDSKIKITSLLPFILVPNGGNKNSEIKLQVRNGLLGKLDVLFGLHPIEVARVWQSLVQVRLVQPQSILVEGDEHPCRPFTKCQINRDSSWRLLTN